jgi:hypothetical protein
LLIFSMIICLYGIYILSSNCLFYYAVDRVVDKDIFDLKACFIDEKLSISEGNEVIRYREK